MQHETVLVVAGGGETDNAGCRGQSLVSDVVAAGAPVIAADGGVDHALSLGLRVDVLVGDFDSASAEGLAAAEASGARIVRYPVEKDATDLELALDEAAALGPRRIVVVGFEAGRLDHLLSLLLLLGAEKYAGVEVDAVLGDAARAEVVRGRRALVGSVGDTVSLLPVHGPAAGVVTEGLVYPLRGETLAPGTSRGVSNEFAAPEAQVSVARGVLLAVRPGGGR